MKIFMISILLGLMGLQQVLAGQPIMTVRGSGYANGLCNGTNSYFCIDDIGRQAERDSEWSARSTCSSYQGDLNSWTGLCSTWCSPSSLPNNADLTSVNCRADCSYDCVIRK